MVRFFVFACGTRRNCQRLPYRCRNNKEGWFEGSKLKVAQLGAVSTPFIPLSVVTAQVKFNGGGLSEAHPYSSRGTPRDGTRSHHIVGLDDQIEIVRYANVALDLKHAPMADTLRTRQSIAAPRNEIVAPFKMRWLARCFSWQWLCSTLKPSARLL